MNYRDLAQRAFRAAMESEDIDVLVALAIIADEAWQKHEALETALVAIAEPERRAA